MDTSKPKSKEAEPKYCSGSDTWFSQVQVSNSATMYPRINPVST